MKVQDFGVFEGPLVLFGGVYSNLQALEALIAVVGDRPAICTGDVVAYCADAAKSVTLMRETGWPVVAGNCETQIAEGAVDCGCGFEEGSACDVLSLGWYPHALSQVDTDARIWMAGLPDIGIFQHEGLRYGVVHGGATRNNRLLWPTSAESDFVEEAEALEAMIGQVDGIVSGHSGIGFQRQVGRWHWINAGAIGLPPHDGRSETRYAVLDREGATLERLSYNVDGARAAMSVVGMVGGYADSLASGIWPSEDVLPEALRR